MLRQSLRIRSSRIGFSFSPWSCCGEITPGVTGGAGSTARRSPRQPQDASPGLRSKVSTAGHRAPLPAGPDPWHRGPFSSTAATGRAAACHGSRSPTSSSAPIPPPRLSRRPSPLLPARAATGRAPENADGGG
ncbi:hypothetical protein Nmel_017605 [Mimus melanotis]